MSVQAGETPAFQVKERQHCPTISAWRTLVEVQEQDGDKLPAEGGDAPSRWLMDSKGKGMAKASSPPTGQMADRPAQKGSGLDTARQVPLCLVFTRYETRRRVSS